jgi:hypothetical protein
MKGAELRASGWPPRWTTILDTRRLSNALKAAGPPLLFGLRLWASVCLALYVAFWLEIDNAYWAGTSAAIMCQPHLGASLRKGWYRLIGTVIGAVAIVVLTACFQLGPIVSDCFGPDCAMRINFGELRRAANVIKVPFPDDKRTRLGHARTSISVRTSLAS